MNTNNAIIGAILLVFLVAGGIYIYNNQGAPSSSTTATSTPTTGATGGTNGGAAAPVPGAPTATTNQNVEPTATAAIVVGSVTPNGALTTYWYEYGASANLGISSSIQTIGSGYVPLAAPTYITNLAKSTNYYYRLVAQNKFGKSTGATYTFRTDASTPAPIGGIPTAKTLAAGGVSRTGANLSGEVTPNKTSTQYWFEYGDSTSLGSVSTLQSAGDGSAKVAVSLPLANLAPATTYYFRLNAQNRFGTVNGSILSFKTSGPAAAAVPVVTTQVANSIGATTATVRGTVNPSDTQTTYWFEYSKDASFGSASLRTTQHRTVAASSDTASVSANLFALSRATTYYYRTVAQNSAGEVRGESLSFKTN